MENVDKTDDSKKNKLLVGIDNEIYSDFTNVCRKEGDTIVVRLEKMMLEEIKKHK